MIQTLGKDWIEASYIAHDVLLKHINGNKLL